MEQPFGHLAENRISAFRAECVVDALKSVEIDEENRALCFVAFLCDQGLGHSILEQLTIGQLGEAAVVRDKMKRPLETSEDSDNRMMVAL